MNAKKVIRAVIPKKLVQVGEEAYRKGRLAGAHVRYGLPARKLRVIAVTGTNGKTSTCNFLNDVLKHAGYSTAMFTTAVVEMAGERNPNTIHRTVPPTKELFHFLSLAKISQVNFVILETTSHALDQHKMWGIPIEIAVMTNLTQDHLDYHGTMEKYAESKARLFSKYMNPKWSVLNGDDAWYEFFKDCSVGQVWTYGKSKAANLKISSLSTNETGLKLRFDTDKYSIVASARVLGEFNGYNLAAVASVAHLLNIAPDEIKKAISAVQDVPGRMEIIKSSKGYTAVVDYAHAPDAIEKALQALRTTTRGKIAIVFGATGERDTTKRPIMGKIAAQNADRIYLTDDETYSEDGDKIRREVMAGIIDAGGNAKTVEIPDRYEAIKLALLNAKKDDMILIAGLGHQDYRAMAEGNIPWQETDVVKKIISEIDA
jgi:UDP-N-acetylmuramoyl-L-alanyl-D-glutamate--2,6-diaminopimelate ligase